MGLVVLLLIDLVISILGRRRPAGWLMSVLICFILLHASFSCTAAFLLFTAAAAVIYIETKPPVRAVPAVDDNHPQQTDVITTAQGQLRGVYTKDRTTAVYAGIPYAKPPVGSLRWKEPQEPESWEGVRICDHFAPMSMQQTHSCIFDSLYQIVGYGDWRPSLHPSIAPVSEDSLYLNIWTPAEVSEKLPVLVFIHGGYLERGQPWYEDYSGKGLASTGKAVVVNMGYRLGIFGFLAEQKFAEESQHHTTGNYGLLDQIQALKWVRTNIAAFGGDPDNITIAGESSGSACVSALCTSPCARGLFTKAVGESSSVASKQPPHSFRTFDKALEAGKKVLEQMRISDPDQLRSIPADKLLKYTNDNHHITIDGYVLKEMPYITY